MKRFIWLAVLLGATPALAQTIPPQNLTPMQYYLYQQSGGYVTPYFDPPVQETVVAAYVPRATTTTVITVEEDPAPETNSGQQLRDMLISAGN